MGPHPHRGPAYSAQRRPRVLLLPAAAVPRCCLCAPCRRPIISVIQSSNMMEVSIWVTRLSMWFQMVPGGVYEKQVQVALQAHLILNGKLLEKAKKLREIKERNYSFMAVMEEFANVIPMTMTQCVVRVELCLNQILTKVFSSTVRLIMTLRHCWKLSFSALYTRDSSQDFQLRVSKAVKIAWIRLSD